MALQSCTVFSFEGWRQYSGGIAKLTYVDSAIQDTQEGLYFEYPELLF